MDFSANFFEACICAGMENIFGIEWQGDRLARDWHEPEPGFFRTWLTRYEMIPGTRLTALTSLPFPGTPLS